MAQEPEIYEYIPDIKDEVIEEQDYVDEAVSLIEVPIKQAFSYFAERENEIAKFYIQRAGEYKIRSNRPDDETDLEKYHRLVAEVHELLSKFQSEKSTRAELTPIDSSKLANNLEVMAKQLKALESVAEGEAQSEINNIKARLTSLQTKVDTGTVPSFDNSGDQAAPRTDLMHLRALERRINVLETAIGNNEESLQNLFNMTDSRTISEATETLSSWLSMLKPGNVQRVGIELDILTQRLEKLNQSDEDQLDPESRAKLDQLFSLLTATDKHRSMIPVIIHRLDSMEELQKKAAQVTTTINHLEKIQSEISDSLLSNKELQTKLANALSNNIDIIKDYSKDIDARIGAIGKASE